MPRMGQSRNTLTTGGRPVVVRSPVSELGLAILAIPLLGMTLAVLASRVQWIDEDRVREIVGRLA
jgi:hypothetical protein